MAKQKLQTYDISFYETQATYDKKITHLEEEIKALQAEHNADSKKAHDAFLKNDASFREKIEQLHHQNETELKRYNDVLKAETTTIKTALKSVIDQFNDTVKGHNEDAAKEEKGFKDTIEELRLDEQKEIADIKEKYKNSIASYQEKLDIYNDNFEKNIQSYSTDVQSFLNKLDDYKTNVDQFETHIVKHLETILEENKAKLNTETKQVDQELNDARIQLTNHTNKQLHETNLGIKSIDALIEEYKETYHTHFSEKYDILKTYIDEQKTSLNNTRYAIQKEYDEQLAELTKQKEIESAGGNTQLVKNIDKKLELYKARSETAKMYETLIHQNMIDFFESEQAYFKQQEQIEKDNIDKLRIFLVSDQTEIKNNIQYFSDVNETLLTHVKSIEKKHIEQQLCHENVRKEYAIKQLGVFQKLKQNIISLTETHLNEIVDYYNQIDSLNQFLDTAEPLKEIRINELKKELEIKELNQRIAFKVGKQTRDIQLIENQKEFDNQMAKLKRDKKHAELEKEIELAKLAKQKDEEISNANLKFNIAKEEYDMRVKNRALERAVLDSQFSFQTKMYEVQKDIAKHKVYRQYDLREKELEYDINIITNEQNYQVEVLERDLEDQTLKLDEKITKIRNQINAYKVKVDTQNNQKKLEIKHKKESIKAKYQRQIEQVDSALKREIKDPKNRLFESRELVESRLDQYNTFNIQFVDFMEHLIETHKYSDELDKCRDKVLKDTTFKTYVHTYLENVYNVLETALKFMHKVDLRRFESQLSNATDASSIKKLERQKAKTIQKYETRLKRLERDLNDRVVVIDTLIQSEYESFKKSSIPTMERFDELLTIFYNKIFDRLRTTQSQLLEETKVMYHPLTKPDEDIIAYAESSAKVAKEKITNELAQTLKPLDEELDAFITAKQDAQNEDLAPLEQEKELLENNLHQVKTTIQKKIHDIHSASTEQLESKKEALNHLHKQAEEDIVSELKEIDRHIDEMTSTYQENIQKLEQKDQEAKTILDYEERILKMALEAAEYRFKDSTEKAENVYLAAIQRLDQKAIHITEDKTETDRAIEQTLKDLYSQQDSFANKNDIKDQIQMVKQEINVDISNKRLERDDLEQKIQDIITSSETVLFASLDEAKQTIELNLEMYFNECQANSSQATDLNEEDHAVMMKHYQAVKDALYVMKETKHKETLSQLEKTNQKIFGKGA